MTETNPTSYEGFVGQSWMTESELKKLIEWVPDKAWMLEVGSASGVTAAKITEAHPETRIVSVDPYFEKGERIGHWLSNRRNHTQNLWCGTLNHLAIFCSAKFDFIFVDGDHFFVGIYGDLLYAEKLLSADGVIVCHDYDELAWRDVGQAVNRFCKEAKFEVCERFHCLAKLRRAA